MAYFHGSRPLPVSQLGCGPGCGCGGCRPRLAGLGERYIPDDDDDDDDDDNNNRSPSQPESPPARAEAPAPAPAPEPAAAPQPRSSRRGRSRRGGRMRTGVAGFAGYSGYGWFGEGAGGGPRVVFVPGIMGSRLVERTTGLPVWGDPAMLAAVLSPISLVAWRLTLGSGDGITNGGRVRPNGLTRLPRIDPYSSIMAALVSTFGAANVLAFSYDWRLANEHNASLLAAAIRTRWPDAAEGGDRRVHLIGHSMGGLVSRWFVERLGGARSVQTLTTVGTPHFGAPEALTLLSATSFGLVPGHAAAGAIPAVNIAMREVARLARGFGSVAQLLPGFDFFLPRGATAPESIAATFARIRSGATWAPIFNGSLLRGPATSTIRNLNRGLIGGVSGLNATLASANVRYFHVAATNHDTVVRAREVLGPAIAPVSARCGDGTVPGGSAVLPAGSHITPLFRTSPEKHSDLFNDASIRALCLDIVRGTSPAPAAGPECAGAPPRTGLEGALGCGACLVGELQKAGLAEAEPLAAPPPSAETDALAAPW